MNGSLHRTDPQRGVTRLGILLAIVAIALLGAGLKFVHWAHIQHRFAEVSEGRLYQSAQMSAEDLTALVQKHGIRSVVDFRTSPEGDLKPDEERQVLEAIGVKFFHFPFSDSEAVPADEFVLAAADEDNLPMLVHCQHGEGRSVLAGAIYRMEFEGWDNERARKATKLLSFGGRSPRTASRAPTFSITSGARTG